MVVIVFAGILLGFLLMFFVLAWGAAMIFLIVPLVMLTVVSIQTFLKIRDRNVDN